MAIRGVYSEAEQQMLRQEADRFDALVGWYRPSRDLVATAESIRRLGEAVDPWNPLWHDETYARGTRWGTIIAYPTYQAFFGDTGIMSLQAPPECGKQYMVWMGEDWDFYRPIRPGDSFRVWRRRPQLYDVTPLDGKSPRTFGLLEGDLDHINQNDELVSRVRNYVQRTFRSDPPPGHAMPEYSYTHEELKYIGRLIKEEEIRGRELRYWEDVRVGEQTKPIVTGPTTIATNALVAAIAPEAGFFLNNRSFFLDSLGEQLGPEFIQVPGTDRYVVRGGPAGRHWSDLAAQAEGEPCAWLFGVISRFSLLRVLTNWMGDDGFLRRFCWRHLTRTRAGDTLIGQGRVTGRRIVDGEHLVDLEVWLRNLRGNVSEAAVATVRLCSRKAPDQWKQGGRALEGTRAPADEETPRAPEKPQFAPGDRVRLRPRAPLSTWPTPPGCRFAGIEGVVTKWVDYDGPMAEFAPFVVCVRLDSAGSGGQTADEHSLGGAEYAGGSYCFLADDLERV